MIGVVYENVRQINQLGYRIIENSVDGFSTETKIISVESDEPLVRISLYGKTSAWLKVSANGQRIKKVKWVTIHTTTGILPKKKRVLLELRKTNGARIWCELPFKEGESTFWR